jgi:drug/metabolite transporter (DMT)-like permease
VFKKKGLLRSQAGGAAGEGVAYLKSPLWWTGMTLMILGELCNFAAYAFVEAIVVTPLGALSVVISAILSSFFLNEKLTFFGWLGCSLCLLGSVIIALNGPKEQSVGQIKVFEKMFLAPGFISWGAILIVASASIVFYFGPKYGKKQMIWYILICSMIGGISVSVTTGLGAAIVRSFYGDNQFKFWFTYFLLGFVVATLLTEVYYLNVALALFNTAMVTPTYYVIFTFFTMVTTIVLFQGLQSSAAQIITLVMGFLVICVGITILQLSKINPTNLSTKLDRRSTILLQAARSQTERMGTDEEKDLTGIEDPGIDALRGSFGTVGSIIRARSARRISQSSRTSKYGRGRSTTVYDPPLSWASDQARAGSSDIQGLPMSDPFSGLKRHQLYDAPVPHDDTSSTLSMVLNPTSPRPKTTIKFGSQDVVHQYNPPGTGDNRATHEHRAANNSSPGPRSPAFPPTAHSQSGSQQPIQEPQIPKLPPPEPPAEGFLLQLDGAVQGLGGVPNFGEETKRLLGISSEQSIRSAPPSFSPRFQQAMLAPGLVQRKGGASQGDSPGGATLKTFPSVTDSGLSEPRWDEEELERQKELAKARERGRSLGKRYPRASAEDDEEESESLWRRQSAEAARAEEGSEEMAEAEQDVDASLPGPALGIRLVTPRKSPKL